MKCSRVNELWPVGLEYFLLNEIPHNFFLEDPECHPPLTGFGLVLKVLLNKPTILIDEERWRSTLRSPAHPRRPRPSR